MLMVVFGLLLVVGYCCLFVFSLLVVACLLFGVRRSLFDVGCLL